MSAQFYQYQAKDIRGQEIPMEVFKDKVVIVVNTASQCGFTPQFAGLEELYQKYQAQGLVILGFPCNQFGGQEPGSASEIQSFCSANYGVSFPMFDKVEVNGNQAHPLFKFLKSKLGSILGSKIKWNFTKFVIDRNGTPVKRYGSIIAPKRMEKLILKLL